MWLSIPLALTIGELFQVVILFWRCCAVLNISLRDISLRTGSLTWRGAPYTTQFLRRCVLMVGAAISDGVNPVVDRGMGSRLGASAVSKLDYALRLCAIPETLTGVTLPLLLSHWAKITATDPQAENGPALRRSVWQSVLVLLILMVPFLLCFYFFRGDIVSLLYGQGEMSAAGQSHIATLLGIYLLGMLPRLISRLFIRAHLARQAHRTVVTATVIRLILNPFFNALFIRYWGLDGIAWSTTLLSYPILAYIMFAFWRQR